MQAKRSLNDTERTEAQRFVRQGKANARTLTRAWVLLKLPKRLRFLQRPSRMSRIALLKAGSTWCCMIGCSRDDGKP